MVKLADQPEHGVDLVLGRQKRRAEVERALRLPKPAAWHDDHPSRLEQRECVERIGGNALGGGRGDRTRRQRDARKEVERALGLVAVDARQRVERRARRSSDVRIPSRSAAWRVALALAPRGGLTMSPAANWPGTFEQRQTDAILISSFRTPFDRPTHSK